MDCEKCPIEKECKQIIDEFGRPKLKCPLIKAITYVITLDSMR